MIKYSPLKFLAIIFAIFLPIIVFGQSSALYRDLTIGSVGEDVRILQQWLNSHGFKLASFGPGSPGQETTYFGALTQAAVVRYQVGFGIVPATGTFDAATRARITGGNTIFSTVNDPNLPAGCTATTAYSPLTGQKCDGSTPTPLLQTQTSKTETKIMNGATSVPDAALLSSLLSGGAGSSAGQNKPFGGLSTYVENCMACSGNYYIRVTPPKSDLPRELIYEPGRSILYEYKQITKPGVELLGTWDTLKTCKQPVCNGNCCTVHTGERIVMVGTSLGTGRLVGRDGTDVAPPEVPPGDVATTTAPALSCANVEGEENRTSYASRGTGYYPDDSALEGGFEDRRGGPLYTLQQYLAGDAPYVSVAMDLPSGTRGFGNAQGVFAYGQKLCIPELEEKYGRPIEFRVVDTGGAFIGRGTSRIDICTANQSASLDSTVNGPLTLVPY